jgi:hypothetical protein
MNIWEARYKALLMGIDDREYIDNAERLVEAAQRRTACGIGTFQENVLAMMDLVRQQTPLVIYKAIDISLAARKQKTPCIKARKSERRRPRGGAWTR